MRLFGSARKHAGWLCINLMPDRIDVSHVSPAARGRPEVLLCESYRKDGDDVAALGRLARVLDLDRYRCTTLLKPGQYQMVQVEAPNVPDAELTSALRWRVKDVIDFSVDAATIDALKIPSAGSARSKQLFAVAARNETIAATVKPFNDAEVPLQVVDVPELAQRNLARCLEDEGRTLVLLAFDEHGGLLTFTCDGELYQYRRMDISREALVTAEGEMRYGLYDRVGLELQRSLDYFDRQFSQLAVSKVVMAPVAGAPDLPDYLAANLNVAVAELDLAEILECVQVPDLKESARQQQCLQLIGAAMRTEGTGT
jgi:MSHA biogenesis protein MshI